MEPRFITYVYGTSLYENTTSWTPCFRMSDSSSDSSTIGMPFGYSRPASDGGYRRPSMLGICAAVNATTSYRSLSR